MENAIYDFGFFQNKFIQLTSKQYGFVFDIIKEALQPEILSPDSIFGFHFRGDYVFISLHPKDELPTMENKTKFFRLEKEPSLLFTSIVDKPFYVASRRTEMIDRRLVYNIIKKLAPDEILENYEQISIYTY